MAALTLIIRAVQVTAALATMALSIAVAHWYNTETLTTAPSQVNFLIFVPVFSLVSVFYLEGVSRWAPRASHPYGSMTFEILNALFYFAGFIALAVFINQLLFCRGPVCAAAKASTGTAALSFLLWCSTFALMIKDVFKGGLRQPAMARHQMKETV